MKIIKIIGKAIVGLLGGIVGLVLIFCIVALVGNAVETSRVTAYAKTFDKVSYTSQLQPKQDAAGNYYFVTDSDFKVMQLTDVHLGGGLLSGAEDRAALNAIAAMITYEKPDLVVFTGDQSFPVPYISGSVNNKRPARMLMTLMEDLGVYYTVVFGNHDSEAYNFFNREKVGSFYLDSAYEHCLFTDNYPDISGVGNQIINVKNSQGLITQTLVLVDSHAYTDGDYLGINWIYDNIHMDQLTWYQDMIKKYSAENVAVYNSLPVASRPSNASDFTTVRSIWFMHIPCSEYKEAYDLYKAGSSDVTYLYGKLGEKAPGVYSPRYEDQAFETIVEVGSTQAVFVGHDHLNNFAITYQGVDLCYGMSIDYLAYSGIDGYGEQRGCKIINLHPDTSIEHHNENYYQSKYVSKYAKESVTMEPYYVEVG